MDTSIIIAVVLALVAGVAFGRRSRRSQGDRAQTTWDEIRPGYVATFPGARITDGELQLVPRIALAPVIETEVAVADGGEVRPIRFVVGPEPGGVHLVGMELPGWEFPMVIGITSSSDDLHFTAPGRWDEAAVMPLVTRLGALGVHNLGPLGSDLLARGVTSRHMNISVSGPEQLAERFPQIVAVLVELQHVQPSGATR